MSLRQLGDQSQGLADLRDRSDGCDPISKPFTSAKSVEGLAGIDGSRTRARGPQPVQPGPFPGAVYSSGYQ